MLLNLRDVLASENLCVSFDYTMDLREEEFYGEHPFQQPIYVQGKLENKADVFYLRAQVVAPVTPIAPAAAYRCRFRKNWRSTW